MPPISTIHHSLVQNVAAISAEFHTHKRYAEFYDQGCDSIGGFVGIYDICIEMGQALTDWEDANGGASYAYDNADIDWIEVVTQYVDAVITQMITFDDSINTSFCLRELPILKKKRPPHRRPPGARLFRASVKGARRDFFNTLPRSAPPAPTRRTRRSRRRPPETPRFSQSAPPPRSSAVGL